MLYTHRIYFKGQEPIGFTTGEVMHGLIEVHGADNVLYIEDMNWKEFLDTCIEVMKRGIILWDGTCPILYRRGAYYRQTKHGEMTVTEIDVRRDLQSYYIENQDMYDIDKSYIERKIIQIS